MSMRPPLSTEDCLSRGDLPPPWSYLSPGALHQLASPLLAALYSDLGTPRPQRQRRSMMGRRSLAEPSLATPLAETLVGESPAALTSSGSPRGAAQSQAAS